MTTAFQANAFQTNVLAFQIDGGPTPPVVDTTQRGGGGCTPRHKRPKYWWEQAREESLRIPEDIPVPSDFEELQVESVELESLVDEVRFDRAYAATVKVLTAYAELLQEQLDIRLAAMQYENELVEKEAAEAKRKRALRMRKIAILLLN